MKVHNKLVRDKIPEIIAGKGENLSVCILGNEQYLAELDRKLQEEVLEYLQAKNADESLEELADVLEVIRAIVHAKGKTIKELESLRIQKAKKRGTFSKKLFLKSTGNEKD